MEKLQRVFKPIFEEMQEKGLLKRRPYKAEGAIKLETLLDALDARMMAYGGTYAEDLAETILQGMGIDTEQPEIVKAYVIGFRGGQMAAKNGAELMDLASRLTEGSPVVWHEEEEEDEDEGEDRKAAE